MDSLLAFLILLLTDLQEYPKQIWYLIVCIIAVATANNIVSIIWAWYRRRHARTERFGPTSLPRKGTLSYWLIPSAIIGAYRIVAFRLRIPAISMTLLDVLLGCIYILALFTWCFANSSSISGLQCCLTHLTVPRSTRLDAGLLGRPFGTHCRRSVSAYRGPLIQE